MLTDNPDVFPNIPSSVSLTLASHTHGGQVNIPIIGRPVVPSEFNQRFAYEHIVENGRHMFVTSGIHVPPEIAVVTSGAGK